MSRTGKPMRMERESSVVSEKLAMEQVAAHQATCTCHPMSVGGIGQIVCCEDREIPEPDATDRSGVPWHVDPLCKIRPEALR